MDKKLNEIKDDLSIVLYNTHYTEGRKVIFKKFDLNIAGLLFLPKNFDENKKYPAIVITHPGGGVKEQCSSLYAKNMADAGYVALAFDASHQGESEGLPRYLEDPASRVEDIRSAVDYLTTLPYVNEEKIGAMGVCAGGGYTMSAIQTEYRIKAAAGISTWDVGDSAKNGFPGVNIENFMQKLLTEVGEQRTRENKGEEPKYLQYVPNSPEEIDENTSTIQKEAYEYYRTPRCEYPTSVNKYLFSSNDKLAAFDAFIHLDTVSPRPILLIVGSKADTIYFSNDAYFKAKEPKELYKIEGATHIDLYDKPEYVTQIVTKLTEYFDKYLKIKGE
jgi:fermentation-respiration switch protein FrsA (DUF1100 family)